MSPKSFDRIKVILGLLLLALTACTQSNSSPTNSIRQILNDSLITNYVREGNEFTNTGDFESSKNSFLEASSLCTVDTDTVVRMKFLNGISQLNNRLGKYEESLESNFELTKLARLKNDSLGLAHSYFNIATNYFNIRKYEEAERYNKSAQAIFKKLGSVFKLNATYVQYAVICLRNKKLSEAEEYLDLTINYYRSINDSVNLAICLGNYAATLNSQKEYHRAIKMHKEAALIQDSINNEYGLALTLGNLSKTYSMLNDLHNAKKYLDSSISIAKTLGSESIDVANLEGLATYYELANRLDSALAVRHRLYDAKLDMLQIESDDKLTRLQEKLEDELEIGNIKKEKKLALTEKEATSLKLYISLVIIFSVVIITLIIYKYQKRVIKSQRTVHEKEKETFAIQEDLLKLTLMNKEKQQKYLEEKLEGKRNEIMLFSQSLKDREQFLDRLSLNISRLKPNDRITSEGVAELKELLNSSSFHGRVRMQKHLENINESFHLSLEKKFPFLSKRDINLASLVLTGLSSKEIGKVLFIESRSVDMKRYRLKKKLNLEVETDLQTFLKNSISN